MRSRKLHLFFVYTIVLCLLLASTSIGAQQQRQQTPVYEPPTRDKKPETTTQDQKDKSKSSSQKSSEPQRQGAEAEPAGAQGQGETLIIDTEEVALDVSVIDQGNNPIYNLTKEDFSVYEDKVKQTLESFSKGEVPLSLGIVIDTSGSMRTKLKTVSDAAAGLIKQLKKEDEGFLAQFKLEPELVRDFTSDKLELEDGLNDLFTGGGTSLLDAIIATADYAHEKGRKGRRKALVVISDGLDRNSTVKEKEVLEAMKEDEVQVYLVGFVDEEEDAASLFRKSPAKRAKELLTRIAEDSGGRAFFPKDLNEMPQIAAQIAKDLRTQYRMTYTPTNATRDGSFRSIRVVVNPKDSSQKLIARTRQGYYAPGGKGQPGKAKINKGSNP